MSFIQNDTTSSKVYAPGYFLAFGSENVTRETRQFAQNSALVQTADNGGKYVPMGSAYPTNDGNAIGLTYEDVDVTTGDMPGSVVTGNAVVYEDRVSLEASAKSALEARGFKFIATEPAVNRPY